jgi:PKD repeat protein
MKPRILVLVLALCSAAQAATTINISSNVAVSGVKRFGGNLGNVTYYDSGQIMKELMFQNPGFEGLLWQSVVQLGSGTTTNAIENGALLGWPTGFWSGGSYEIIYGAAKGRTGTVATSIRPMDPGGSSSGTTYVFADSGAAPANGSYMILRKQFAGAAGNGAAFAGWNTNVNGGATITTELADLPPGTPGQQCVRLTATNTGQSATLSASCDTWPNVSFLQLNGNFRLIFKAKGVGGNNRLAFTLRRGSGAYWINTQIQLTNAWQTYTNTFTAAETGSALGNVSLQFSAWAGNAVLLDDVSLRQTDSSPLNTTPLRDPVIAALTDLNPGILRIAGNWSRLGDSLDNELAEPFGRQRSGYTEFGTGQNLIQMGLHEFLEVCEFTGAEPWYTFPVTFSTQELANLMDYLGGPTNTVYGAVRAARGHPAPWTAVFARIHLELGNENWNGGYRGGCIADTAALGARGNDLFAVVKSSPWYDAAKFNCILGEQWVNPWRVSHVHNACTNYDTMTIAGYMASRIDSYATTEELFGSVFAEPEWWSKPNGLMYQDYTNLLYSGRPVPLSIYEVNINVPGGGITNSQAALTAYTPSLGAGLAVADHMLLALRELKARDQCLFSLGGYDFGAGANRAYVWGTVRDMGVTDRKRPQFLACQLANRALAGDCVQTTHTGDDPTWTVNNLNYVTYTNAHYLQSYAFASGTNRSAIVFNLHRTSALDVNFAGPLAPTGRVAASVLTSANITDNNESSNVVAIATQTLTNFNAAAGLALPPYSMTLLEWTEAAPVPEPAPVAAFSAVPAAGIAPLLVNFTDLSTGSITNCFWNFGDGATTNLAAATNLAHSYATAGTNLAQLIVSGPAGDSTNSVWILVQAPAPVYTLIYAAGAHGLISGLATQTVARGASGSAITVAADAGYQFQSWSDGRTDNPRADLNIQGGVNVTALYVPLVALTVQSGAPAQGTVTGGGVYTAGAARVISAQAFFGNRFLNWSDGDTNATRTLVLGAGGTNLTANFLAAPVKVLLQNGAGGMAGLWTLGTNYAPAAWAPVTGALGNGWVLRALNQQRILLQAGTGGMIGLWDLNTNGVPVRWWLVSGPLPGWIARDLDGQRILLQAGDGGMTGIWTLNSNQVPIAWSGLSGPLPGWIARALRGQRVLLQYGSGSPAGYWTLDGANRITGWQPLTATVPAGWTLRAMTAGNILLQAGDGGMAGLWDLDANGQPTAWHPLAPPMPGWILRSLDQP